MKAKTSVSLAGTSLTDLVKSMAQVVLLNEFSKKRKLDLKRSGSKHNFSKFRVIKEEREKKESSKTRFETKIFKITTNIFGRLEGVGKR